MKFDKSNNAQIGKLFEQEVACAINRQINSSCEYKKSLSKEQTEFIKNEAKTLSNLLCADKAVWVGNKTKKESCDIIVDDVDTELKFVSGGHGTYLNTTLFCLSDFFKFESYKVYLEKYGVYDYLENFFGDAVRKGNSPVTMEESHNFRLKNKSAFSELKKIEKIAREKYNDYIYDCLSNDKSKTTSFLINILSKNVSDKKCPDRLIVYNYNKKKIVYDVSKYDITRLQNSYIFKKTKSGFTINGIRFVIGWQNGTGLNNPTLRVFI